MNMKIVFIPVAIFMIAFTVGIHFLVFTTLVKYLGIDSERIRLLMIILFYLLGVGFFVMSALGHYNNNIFIKTGYIITAVWYGLLSNLAWMSVVIWALNKLNERFAFTADFKTFAIALMAVAVLITIYSVWAARTPKVKEITVKLDNLPTHWIGKTAVKLSDIHLGVVYGAKWMNGVIEKVNTLGPDLVFITGDYYDGSAPNYLELAEPLKNLKAKNGIFYVPGNHEFYSGNDYAMVKEAIQDTEIQFMQNEFTKIDGLTIIGADYIGHGKPHNLSDVVSEIEPDEPSILLQHEPRILPEVLEEKVDLQLSGHTHYGQIWPWNLFTYLVYSKYHYVLQQKGDLTLYTSNGTGAWGPPMRLWKRSEIVKIILE